MPQPLSRVNAKAGLYIGNAHQAGRGAIVARPELAIKAMEAVASWSIVERFRLDLYLQLAGGEKSAAADMYLALDGDSAKNRAIEALANNVLANKPDHLRVFNALQKIAATNAKSRNKLAHWTCGYSEDLPDALLFFDPKTMLSGDPQPDLIYVYYAGDFESLTNANHRLCGYLRKLQMFLDEDATGHLFQRLLGTQEIQERLNGQA